MKLGILGAGYSGKMIAHRFAAADIKVWGTTRSETKFAQLAACGCEPVAFDGSTVSDAFLASLKETTHLVVSIAPDREENTADPEAAVDPVLVALSGYALSEIAPKLQWVSYLSTVGVYGNHDGAWVDEETQTQPVSARSRQRVRAEKEWLRAGEKLSLPVAVARLSGIYGPGRNGLINASKGKSRRLVKEGQVFNRIHVADIAEAVWLMAQKKAGGVFNITDDEPAPPQDVVTFCHTLIGKPPPDEIDFETAELSPMARSFYGENKRVSNAKSKSELGLAYTFPNYRVAMRTMWEDDSWKSESQEIAS